MTEDEIRAIQNEVRTWAESTVKHSVTLSEKLARYYKTLFGKPACSTCPGKIAGYISQILNLNPKQKSMQSNSRYRLKKVNGREQLIQNNGKIAGLPTHITNANLTDEIAEQLLNSNYARFIEEVVAAPNLHPKPDPNHVNVRTMVDKVPLNPALQQVLDSMNKQQIILLLRENKIPFDKDSSKADLAKLWAEHLNAPSKK